MNSTKLKEINPRAYNAWVHLCTRHTETLEEAMEWVNTSFFEVDVHGDLCGDGAYEFTRYRWDGTTWVDDDLEVGFTN